MTAVLRDLPFLERADEASVGLERIAVRAYQIIVWVSVTAREATELPPHAARLPALIDTGHGHNFSIHERHVTSWVGLPLERLPRSRTVRVDGVPVPLHAAAVWLHPNVPGQRDRLCGGPAYRLEVPGGIALYPSQSAYPRLPLLGLRTLVRNRLHLALDPEQCVVNVRTPDWRTKLLRWFR